MTTSTKPVGVSVFRTWERSWIEAEALCRESGGNPAQLPAGLLQWVEGGSFLPPRALLAALEPHLLDLHRESDPRVALAEAFMAIWNHLHPFAPIRPSAFGAARSEAASDSGSGPGSRHELWLEIRPPERGTTLDFGWLMLPLFRKFPRAFGLPEFETVQAVADPRRVHAVLEEDTGLRHTDGGLEIGGLRLGESILLGTHLRDAGLDVPASWEEDTDACLVQADYYDPRRRRVTLQAGCAYGTPSFVFRVAFRGLRLPTWNPLSNIIRAIVDESPDAANASLATALKGSSALLSEPMPAYKGPFRFVYHQADDSISCDGRHLTKNVPARILRRLVRDFVQSGRREFEFRTFKRDSEIVTNRKRPNFEVRLRRVQEVIQGVPCGLILNRPRPGLLELRASGPIEYSEEG